MGPKEKRRVRSQGPEAHRGSGRSSALHVTIIQRQEGVVTGELQGNGVPEPVIYWSVRDTHNAKGVVTVQLKPESTPFYLRKEEGQE